jgi:hypothetical protein
MPRREIALACLLVVAAGLVVKGAAVASEPAGWVVAGLLVAGLAWLLFGEVGG